MARPVYLVFKIGNNGGIKHRMLVDYYDPLEWGHTPRQEASHFTNWMKTVYLVMRVNRGWNYKDMITPQGDTILGSGAIPDTLNIKHVDYRERAGTLDLDAVATEIGDPDLLTKLRSKNPYDILDATSKNISETLVKDSRVIPLQDVSDLNAVTSGSHTIGTAKDYATITAYFADVGTLTGDITGTVETSMTLTANSLWGVTMGSNDANLLTNTAHSGDPTAGNIITTTYTGGQTIDIRGTRTGTHTIDGLSFKWGTTPGSNRYMIQDAVGVAINNSTIKNCMFDGEERSNASGIYNNNPTSSSIKANNIGWGLNYAFITDENSVVYDNCGSYNATNDGFWMNNNSGTLRSCYSFASGGSDFNANISSMTRNNLASSDTTATGTAPQISLTTANEIETTDTDPAFMQPKSGSTISTNGNTTHAVATDAIGTTWDASDPSIGPYQFVSGTSVPVFNKHYRNQGQM
jgi:hypothetical protein